MKALKLVWFVFTEFKTGLRLDRLMALCGLMLCVGFGQVKVF